jgi:inhibitor of cysteine peptidase
MTPDAITLTCERSGETIALRKGQEVVLSLPENPGSGFRWRIVADGAQVVDDQYAGGGNGAVGGRGTRTVRLVAERVGDEAVTATLQRSWEDPAKAAERCEFHFKVS